MKILIILIMATLFISSQSNNSLRKGVTYKFFKEHEYEPYTNEIINDVKEEEHCIDRLYYENGVIYYAWEPTATKSHIPSYNCYGVEYSFAINEYTELIKKRFIGNSHYYIYKMHSNGAVITLEKYKNGLKGFYKENVRFYKRQ
jgi:hypothetical protein